MTPPRTLSALRALCDAATPGEPQVTEPDGLNWPMRGRKREDGSPQLGGVSIGGCAVPHADAALWAAMASPDRARRFVALAEAAAKMLDMIGSEVSYDSDTLLGTTVAARALRAALAAILEDK